MKSGLLTIVNSMRTPDNASGDMKRGHCRAIVRQACAIDATLTAVCTCFKTKMDLTCFDSLKRRRLSMAEWIRKSNLRMELRKKDQYMCRGAPFLFKWGRRIPLNAEKKKEI
jgi:hypothetical protein